MKKLSSISIVSLCFLASFVLVSAQVSTVDQSIPTQFPEIQEQIDTVINPQIPAPYDQVSIALEAYGTDLNAAKISWSVNGKTVQSGIGQKSIIITLGGKGETTKVKITIVPINGISITKNINITPEDVDLIWEANTYTPPFYKGKALFTPEGDLTFTALTGFIINGKSVSPSSLIYKWSKDTTVLGDKSGYGKNTLSLTGSIISKPMYIRVDVSTPDGSAQASQSITVSPQQAEARLYENNPLYGILFNKTISSDYVLNGEEAKFEAFPFFFSGKSRSSPDISYAWRINNKAINVPPSQHSVIFRNDSHATGNASISIEITDAVKLLQYAIDHFIIGFDSSVTKNYFGI